MKTITFNYTKKDGSSSERTLLAMVTPGGSTYAGIDVSELSPVQAAEFMKGAQRIHEHYLDALKSLQAEFDLKHSYRQFLVSGMENITEI